MRATLRTYGLAFGTVAAAAALRFLLIPILGNRFGFDFFVLSVFVSARYLGLAPAVFALSLSALGVTVFHALEPGVRDPYFPLGLATYLIVGGILILLCNSEHAVRSVLEKEIAERKAIEADLRESQQQLLLAIKAGRLGTWQLDLQTNKVKWSELMEPMHGYAPGTFGGTLDDAIAHNHPQDQETIRCILSQHPETSALTYRVIGPDGRIRWIQAMGQTLYDESGQPTQMLGACLDVTEQKEADVAVRASEARLQGILDNTTALVYLKDLQGRYLLGNRSWEKIVHAVNGSIDHETTDDVFPKESADKFVANDRRVIETGKPLQVEEMLVHGDEEHTYVTVKFPIKDASGAVTAVGGISTDITDRKRAQQALEAEQELLRHTVEVQERERQLITYEIHDGLVQYITGALMQLEATRPNIQSADAAEKIESAISALQKAVGEGRQLINGIRTPVLDDWGVVAAVEQLLEDEERAHVHVEFIKDEQLGRMAPNIEETLYRITQEALTNIRKHSQATQVRVELCRRADRVHLVVRDWGVGFTQANGSQAVHGLRGMTSRARITGGQCTISSAPGEGTQITVDVPYMSRNQQINGL